VALPRAWPDGLACTGQAAGTAVLRRGLRQPV